ncbi:MAG: AMIN domain-containing protein [Candidatus Aminicenantales bacterium]
MLKRTIVSMGVVILVLAAFAISSWGAEGKPGQSPTTVKSIGYLKVDKGLNVTVRVDGEFVSQAMVLSGPNRLVIDIAPAQKIEAQPYYEVNVSGLASIRTGQFQPSIARVIFDFSGPIPAYEIQKTETGFTVKFSLEEKPVAPPVVTRLVPVVKEAKEEAKTEVIENEAKEYPGFYNTSIGIMLGTYQSPSQDFRAIYGQTTDMQFGLNLTRTLVYYNGLQLDVSLEARKYSKSGFALLDGAKTDIKTDFSMTPISLSGRLLYQTEYVIPFIGFGTDWYSFDEKSDLHSTTGSTSGYHFQAGAYIVFPWLDQLRIKLYYKFTKATASANGFDIGLGGNEYGVGLSFAFDLFKKGVLFF